MSHIYLKLGDAVIAINCPDQLTEVIATFWPRVVACDAQESTLTTIRIDAVTPKSWMILGEGFAPVGPVAKADIITALTDRVQQILATAKRGFVVHAAAASWDQETVLVMGAQGSGKSHLLAWLVERGLAMLADNDLFFMPEYDGLVGLGGPVAFAAGDKNKALAGLKDFSNCLTLAGTDRAVVLADPDWVLPNAPTRPAFVIFVEHASNSHLTIAPLTVQDVAAKIKNIHPDLDSAAIEKLQAYLGDLPAFSLNYAGYDDIENVVDQLCYYAISVKPDADVFRSYVQRMCGSQASRNKVMEIPARTDRKLSPRLTIGMATYDDYDGVYFSLQAIRLYHPEILDEVEFLVLDNNPTGACAPALKRLENNIPNYRYIPATGIKGTAVRDYIFYEAYGEYVLSMDCHVFFTPGSLKRLLDYYAANPDTDDLLQGPLLHDDLNTVATHFVPKWSSGMFGIWSESENDFDPDGTPFDIPSQGLGIFSCKKSAWPGFNPSFQGFGGEEGYIHQKFRNLGRRTLCLPFLQWMHRFERPYGVAYRNVWEDRIRNYVLGFEEVGMPLDEMRAHFTELVNKRTVDAVFQEVAAQKAKPVIGQAHFPKQKLS
ncbi:glycosyltransferase [Yoonia tamlensis]|nr:glycosyltransferase [Yoonia tamlensis]